VPGRRADQGFARDKAVPEQCRHLGQLELPRARAFDQREQWPEFFLGGDQGSKTGSQGVRHACYDDGGLAAQRIHAGTTAPELSRLSV
jgi:hypothetical protein